MDDELWEYYRKEAKNWAVKCDQAFRSSQIAYKCGDGLKAKNDSIFGKYYKQQCEKANKSAANAIFIHMNHNRPPTEIDLHGLYVNEAIEKLETCVVCAINNGMEWLDVIVGQGHNSEDGPKIKPSVKQFAIDNGIHYTLYDNNPGCIRFNFRHHYDDDESSNDDGTMEPEHQYPKQIIVPLPRRSVRRIEPQYLQNRETFESSKFPIVWIVVILFFLYLCALRADGKM